MPVPWERINRFAVLSRRGGRDGEEKVSTGTRERIVLIRQRYRKLKFNSRVASGVTHRVGPYRLSRGTRIHGTSYPEYVIRARKLCAILSIRLIDTLPRIEIRDARNEAASLACLACLACLASSVPTK